MAQRISVDQLGLLKRLGVGGQGVVYEAPLASTTFAKSMVFKEYKAATLAALDVAALEAMPAFLEALPYLEGAELISRAAWPCAVVEKGGGIVGFLMPSIPDDFHVELWTSKGPSRVVAEFQHLLNTPEVLAMRFPQTTITDRQRYELLKQVALALLFFHRHGLCVGDISPKNLLFALNHKAAVYFVDCDAMRLKDVSLAHQVETPGWEVPSGEAKATVFSDRYKLGLLALRLLAGSQDGRDPARVPSTAPSALCRVVTTTLTRPPDQRPSTQEWISALEAAIAATPSGWTASPPIPPQPAPAPPPLPPQPVSSPPTPTHTVGAPSKTGRGWLVMPLAAAAVGGALFWISGEAADVESAVPATLASTPPQTVREAPTQTITQTETETATATVTVPPSSSRPSRTTTSRSTTLAPQTTSPWDFPPPRSSPTPEARAQATLEFPPQRASSAWGGTVVGTCDEGGSCGVKQRIYPFTEAPRAYSTDLVDGTVVAVVCGTEGDTRSSRGYGTSNIWYRLVNGAYLPSVFVDIPTWRVPTC